MGDSPSGIGERPTAPPTDETGHHRVAGNQLRPTPPSCLRMQPLTQPLTTSTPMPRPLLLPRTPQSLRRPRMVLPVTPNGSLHSKTFLQKASQ